MNLDTSFLVDLERRDSSALAKLRDLTSAGQRLATTVVTAAELYRGVFGHPRPKEKRREVDELLELLVVLEMNLPAAVLYGRLHDALRRQGILVADRDLLIAAVGLAFGESEILTRDIPDFERIPGVTVVSY